MLELLVGGAVALAGLAVFGLLWAVVAMICWVIVLPFKLLGFAFKGLAFLLALPFILVIALLAAVVFGVGAFLFAIPALPVIVLAAIIWWFATRNRNARVA